MRKLFFPAFLFFGLVVGAVVFQHEGAKRRSELERSLGGTRVGVSLETAAAFARQLENVDEEVADAWLRGPGPRPSRPSIAATDEDR